MNAKLKSLRMEAKLRIVLLRVLFVEDSLADAFLLERALTRGGFRVVCERVDTREDMSRALDERQWDLVLCDHSMPQFNSPEALQLLKQKKLDLPFIIVSGHIEEDMAISAMDSGAHDYIMKDRLARLVLRRSSGSCAKRKSATPGRSPRKNYAARMRNWNCVSSNAPPRSRKPTRN